MSRVGSGWPRGKKKTIQEVKMMFGLWFSLKVHGLRIGAPGSESIESTLRKRRILFAGFIARMEYTRLPKCVMFGEMVGGAGCVRGQEKEWMGCFLDDLRAFGTTPNSERLQRRPRGNGAERQNKGRNISWQNGSLQKN